MQYSDKYVDSLYEYRHVKVPRTHAGGIPKSRLMSEAEWRRLGVQQSKGWQHYMRYAPEPTVLLFRRRLN